MGKFLVTGGTVFVSKAVATYFVNKGHEVYVLNRGTREQVPGVKLIKADRDNIGDALKGMEFDTVIDVTSYTGDEINKLLDSLYKFDNYIMISSSAVYPETNAMPFVEEGTLGNNKFWTFYGTNKIAAEQELLSRFKDAYIIRPPYLYGEGNNVYREAFVFDCAMKDKTFYLPKDGSMNMQFFNVKDLCRFIDLILEKKPENHIFNVGNNERISVKDWVKLCYKAAGKEASFVNVDRDINQREYFPFSDYDYYLDITNQSELMPDTMPLDEGLKEAYNWYVDNRDKVNKRPYYNNMKSIIIRDNFEFRYINKEETDQAINLEQICFPPNEACSPKNMTIRIEKAAEQFLVAVDKKTGKIAGFLNGLTTNEKKFRDEFFTDADLYNKDGDTIMILGLVVHPDYRLNGLARELVKQYSIREKERGRKEALLTCLDDRVPMYLKFGFTDKGIADSTWGGEEWHEMSLMF